MDALLARIGYQALNMAMRSGIAITSTYAISQCSRLMKKVDDKDILDDLRKLQEQLNSKIKVRNSLPSYVRHFFNIILPYIRCYPQP